MGERVNVKARQLLESKANKREAQTGDGKAVLVRLPQELYDRLRRLQAKRLDEAVELGDNNSIGLHHVIIGELNRVVE